MEILVIIGAAALVAFTIIYNAVRIKRGKRCCDCSSCACPCSQKKAEEKREKEENKN